MESTTRVSRGQDELIGMFKMVAGYVISVRGQLLSTNIFQQELKELMRFGMELELMGTGSPTFLTTYPFWLQSISRS